MSYECHVCEIFQRPPVSCSYIVCRQYTQAPNAVTDYLFFHLSTYQVNFLLEPQIPFCSGSIVVMRLSDMGLNFTLSIAYPNTGDQAVCIGESKIPAAGHCYTSPKLNNNRVLKSDL